MSGFYDKITNRMRFAFQFDKIYKSYAAMDDGLTGNNNTPVDFIYIGRYVLIQSESGEGCEERPEFLTASRSSWDGTVWQKTRLGDGKEKYVFVADLNSIKPKLTITTDNPLKEEDYLNEDFEYENSSYFAEDSNDIEWKLHVPALWNIKLGEVEFNKLGFDKNKSNIVSRDDDIFHSYGQTGLKYWDRESQTLKVADDIYKINMLLPSIGNTVSNLWNLIYGKDVEKTQRGRYFFYDYSDYQFVPNATKEDFEDVVGRLPRDNEYIEDDGKLWVWSGENNEWSEVKDEFLQGYDHTSPTWFARNKDIRWNSYDGLRGISKDNVDTRFRFSNYNFRENLESLAGSINSAHDLMGMIIRDYETLDNIENWDPSKIYYIDEDKKFYRKSEKNIKYRIKEDPNPESNYEKITILNLDAESVYREDWGQYPRFLEIGSINEDIAYPAYGKYINYRKPTIKEHIAGSMYDKVEFSEEIISSNWEDIKPAWYQDGAYTWKLDNEDAPVRPTQPYYHIQNPQKIENGKQVYIPGLYWAILWEENEQGWKRKKVLPCTSPYDNLAANIQSLFGVVATDENVRFYNIDAAKLDKANIEGDKPTVSYTDGGYVAFDDLLAFEENKYYSFNNNAYTLIDFYRRNNEWTTNENQRGSSIDQPDQWWIDNKNSNLYILTQDNFKRAGVVYALTTDQDLWYYPVEDDYVKETIWRLPVIKNQELRLSKIINKVSISYDDVFKEGKYFKDNIGTPLTQSDFEAETKEAYRRKERYVLTSNNPDFKVGDRYYGEVENIGNLNITLGVIDWTEDKWEGEEIPGYSYDQGTMNGLILATSNALDKLNNNNNNLENALKQISVNTGIITGDIGNLTTRVSNLENLKIKFPISETDPDNEAATVVNTYNIVPDNTTAFNLEDGLNIYFEKVDNNTLKINATRYVHPTAQTATPAAVKVGRDNLGHVTLGNILTASDVGLGNVLNKAITVTSSSVSDGSKTFEKYTHPTTAGNKHIPSGGSSGQFLGWDSTGTAKWVDNPNEDTKVTQTATTENEAYEVLFSATADNTTRTEDTKKTNSLVYNPSSKILTIGNTSQAYIQLNGDGSNNPNDNSPKNSITFKWHQNAGFEDVTSPTWQYEEADYIRAITTRSPNLKDSSVLKDNPSLMLGTNADGNRLGLNVTGSLRVAQNIQINGNGLISGNLNVIGDLTKNGHRAVWAKDGHGQPHSFQLDYDATNHVLEIWVDGGQETGDQPFVIFARQ